MKHNWKPLSALLFTFVLAACGTKESSQIASAPAVQPAVPQPSPQSAAPAPQPAAAGAGGDLAQGAKVFKSTCALCHQTGAAGAPVLGNKADWGPRIARGKETLYDHALHGFTGSKGAMPPKGGNTSLSDADVKAAVDYMVSQAQ